MSAFGKFLKRLLNELTNAQNDDQRNISELKDRLVPEFCVEGDHRSQTMATSVLAERTVVQRLKVSAHDQDRNADLHGKNASQRILPPATAYKSTHMIPSAPPNYTPP